MRKNGWKGRTGTLDSGNEKAARAERKQWFSSPEFHQKYFYPGEDLGVVYHPDKSVFSLWSPTAQRVVLNLYSDGNAEREEREPKLQAGWIKSLDMEREEQGVWRRTVEGNLDGTYYTYSVTGEDGCTRETADPYAKACGVNGLRSMAVDLKKTDPAGWETDRRPENIYEHPVICELHIKDFSHDAHSGVEEKLRGKYLAFTQTHTSVDGKGGYPTCLSYLQSLGITYVHLLPAFDYASVDESAPYQDSFNWGYDPLNYNIPEGSYATDPREGHVRIREFKEMVMALHRAGIGVIMDVVFNHTYSLDSCLEKTVPGYYYRMNGEGVYSTGSACGNDTASEREMFRKYMADSVCYWAGEYHIDGFRFDLMGLHDVRTMNQIRERLDLLPGGKKILMYGEPWAASATDWENDAVPATASNVSMLHPGIGIFCDRTRDGIKGSVFRVKERGYISGRITEVMSFKQEIQSAVCAWCGPWKDPGRMEPLAPSQIITYTSAHDDYTLWDKLVVSLKRKPDYTRAYPELLQMNRMAAGIIFTSLGTPFFMAGEEFARTKQGCSNSYNASPGLNQLDWKRAEEYRQLTDYYRFLIGIRKELPVLERKDEGAVHCIHFAEREDAVIGYELRDPASEKKWKHAMIWLNPYPEKKEALLPAGTWCLLSDGRKHHCADGYADVRETVTLQGRSVTILAQ